MHYTRLNESNNSNGRMQKSRTMFLRPYTSWRSTRIGGYTSLGGFQLSVPDTYLDSMLESMLILVLLETALRVNNGEVTKAAFLGCPFFPRLCHNQLPRRYRKHTLGLVGGSESAITEHRPLTWQFPTGPRICNSTDIASTDARSVTRR